MRQKNFCQHPSDSRPCGGIWQEVLLMTDKQKSEITGLRAAGVGYTVIARQMGLPRDTVRSFCRRNGLAGETAGGKEEAAGCPEDGFCREGMKKRVFCSKECREKWWHGHPDKVRQKAVYSFTCAGCGQPFTAYGNAGRKCCSHGCYIRAHFNGGGGDE